MGKKYITVNASNIIQETFDDDNNNVPDDAIAISDADFSMFNDPHYNFGDYEIAGGTVQLATNADDNKKTRIIESFTPEMFKSFAEIIMDELNILRAANGLSERTMAQLKTAMKNKLS